MTARFFVLQIAAIVLVAGIGPAHAHDSSRAAQRIDAAMAANHRDMANAVRDKYRHPRQTLLFFGLEPDMTVVEIWPSGGWYAEILAPVLRDGGKYYAAGYDAEAEGQPAYRARSQKAFEEKLAANPEVYDQVIVTKLLLPDSASIAPPGSADLVLTFRNTHTFLRADQGEAMFATFYASLKPGGILGVVQHRAKPDTPIETMKKSGYVTERKVIELAKGAGFVLAGRSEINGNPKDSADYPDGVWTLPPSLRLKDKDRAKYLETGESDRMTLKFIKPVAEEMPTMPR